MESREINFDPFPEISKAYFALEREFSFRAKGNLTMAETVAKETF